MLDSIIIRHLITKQSFNSIFEVKNVRVLPYVRDIVKSVIS